MKQSKKITLVRPKQKDSVPLSLWHTAKNLKLLRLTKKNKESGDDNTTVKIKKKGRKRRRLVTSKMYSEIASKALSPILQTKYLKTASSMVLKPAKSEDSIHTPKVGDLEEDALGEKSLAEDIPDEWVRSLESHYRKLTAAQNVLELLRRSKQYPVKVKIVKNNKRLKKKPEK